MNAELEKWIARHSFYITPASSAIDVDDLRALFDGKVLVPVEFVNVLDNAPYINLCNYDHDQVRELNTAVREAFALLAASQEQGK